jgi:hypothetical protein
MPARIKNNTMYKLKSRIQSGDQILFAPINNVDKNSLQNQNSNQTNNFYLKQQTDVSFIMKM